MENGRNKGYGRKDVMERGYVNPFTKRYFLKIFGALVLAVVFVCALIPLVANATEGDIVSNNRTLVAGEPVKDGSLEGCQIDQGLKYVLITDSKSFDLSPKNGLIPLYALHKFQYQNVSNGEAVKDSVIKATSLYLDDLEKLIVPIDGYEYQDMAIDNSIITFRYAPKGANGAQGGQGRALTVEEQILADTLPLGNYGRLYIPKFNISIRLNECIFNLDEGSDYQQSVRFSDMGAVGLCGKQQVAEDLITQGFGDISKLGDGDIIYIKKSQTVVDRYMYYTGGVGSFSDQFYFEGHPLSVLNNNGLALCCKLDSSHCYIKMFKKSS